jgi:quinolinate synthase
MKMITPERLLKTLEREQFEVSVDPEVAKRAEGALLRMLEVK